MLRLRPLLRQSAAEQIDGHGQWLYVREDGAAAAGKRLRQQIADLDRRIGLQLEAALARVPDLTKALQDAPPQLKRQIFDAVKLRVTDNKQVRSIGISATISDVVAKTLQNTNDLPEEVVSIAEKGE